MSIKILMRREQIDLLRPRKELVDFYDGGDHVHIWDLKLRKDEHIWGLRLKD